MVEQRCLAGGIGKVVTLEHGESARGRDEQVVDVALEVLAHCARHVAARPALDDLVRADVEAHKELAHVSTHRRPVVSGERVDGEALRSLGLALRRGPDTRPGVGVDCWRAANRFSTNRTSSPSIGNSKSPDRTGDSLRARVVRIQFCRSPPFSV